MLSCPSAKGSRLKERENMTTAIIGLLSESVQTTWRTNFDGLIVQKRKKNKRRKTGERNEKRREW